MPVHSKEHKLQLHNSWNNSKPCKQKRKAFYHCIRSPHRHDVPLPSMHVWEDHCMHACHFMSWWMQGQLTFDWIQMNLMQAVSIFHHATELCMLVSMKSCWSPFSFQLLGIGPLRGTIILSRNEWSDLYLKLWICMNDYIYKLYMHACMDAFGPPPQPGCHLAGPQHATKYAWTISK